MEKRFSHPKGRREDKATKLASGTALNGISGMRTILDMPCGTGRYTSFSYEKGYLYFGADMSVEMMKVMAGKGSSHGCKIRSREETICPGANVVAYLIDLRSHSQ